MRYDFAAAVVVACLFAVTFQGCLLLKIRPTGEGVGVKASDLPQVAQLEGDKVRSLLQPDRISAIDNPKMVPAQEADFMADDELVLGVARGVSCTPGRSSTTARPQLWESRASYGVSRW